MKISNRGVSLIEIMVVMALIAVLAAVAAPSYKHYKAKARQKEGLMLLSLYFTAAQNTKMEYDFYPGEFVQTAFQPMGVIGYRLRAELNPGTMTTGLSDVDPNCTRTQDDCNCGGGCPGFKTWSELPQGSSSNYGIAFPVNYDVCPPLAAMHSSDSTFSVRVAGVITLNTGTEDAYGIDERKRLIMCSDGLN